ncbi:MAG: BadF/BadG/BcrA/BcrD ATPase family protein, partial [Candidatus Helarchaeota archaeon]
MIVAGVDIGSLTGKCVILKAAKQFGMDELLASSITHTRVKPVTTANIVFEDCLRKLNFNRKEIEYTVGTGYGRVKV